MVKIIKLDIDNNILEDDNTEYIYLIKIGQNAIENDDLIKIADQNDLWFHLDNLPSCHLILSSKSDITKNTIRYCAEQVKNNTKYRNLKKVRVNYTQIKNIKRTKTIGKVIIMGKHSTITI